MAMREEGRVEPGNIIGLLFFAIVFVAGGMLLLDYLGVIQLAP
jgi:hypothetical protein